MEKFEHRRTVSALAAVFGLIVFPVGPSAAAETPVVRGADRAVAVSEAVDGRDEVKLVATVGPDTYDYDQAVWCEPVFVMRDGTRVDATALEIRSPKAGWGKVQANCVNWGGSKAAKVGGESFQRFISAHAPSSLVIPVPKGAVRFEAKGGLTAPKGKGSCTFKVEAGEFTRGERIAELSAAMRAAFPAIDRLLAHRRASNPEFAPRLDALAARLEEVKLAVGEGGTAVAGVKRRERRFPEWQHRGRTARSVIAPYRWWRWGAA